MSQDIATPINPAQDTQGQLLDSLFDFILFYGVPAILPGNIYHAYQNRMALPALVDEYAIIHILSSVRHGTAIETQIPAATVEDNDKVQVESLFEYLVQIDFFARDDLARQRAMTLANIGRSSLGPQFFAPYGVSILYMDDPKDLTFISDSDQYVQRWSITMHLTMPEVTTVELQAFDRVKLNRLENVDVHRPPVAD